MTTQPPLDSTAMLLRGLKLPMFVRHHAEVAAKAEREGWTFGNFLLHLAQLEVEERRRRVTVRNEMGCRRREPLHVPPSRERGTGWHDSDRVTGGRWWRPTARAG